MFTNWWNQSCEWGKESVDKNHCISTSVIFCVIGIVFIKRVVKSVSGYKLATITGFLKSSLNPDEECQGCPSRNADLTRVVVVWWRGRGIQSGLTPAPTRCSKPSRPSDSHNQHTGHLSLHLNLQYIVWRELSYQTLQHEYKRAISDFIGFYDILSQYQIQVSVSNWSSF